MKSDLVVIHKVRSFRGMGTFQRNKRACIQTVDVVRVNGHLHPPKPEAVR